VLYGASKKSLGAVALEVFMRLLIPLTLLALLHLGDAVGGSPPFGFAVVAIVAVPLLGWLWWKEN
jgi:hypothetical protein